MEFLVYILAGFGIVSLLVLLTKIVVWCFNKCKCDKKLVPIGESAAYTLRHPSLMNVKEKEALQQLDLMLEQYTKPKVVVSRQCICPFCTKEPQKIIINDEYGSQEGTGQNNLIPKETTEEIDGKTNESYSDFGDSYIEVDDIVIIDDSKEEMPCNIYNNVVLELKDRFSSEKKTGVKMLFDVNEDYP